MLIALVYIMQPSSEGQAYNETDSKPGGEAS